MECLYHAILPKGDVKSKYDTKHDWIAYGIPSTLVVDNGKEFMGNDLKDAADLLGFTIERMPVRTPHYKGVVERAFKTVDTMLLHPLPGTTFSNVFEKGDYDSAKQACIYVDQVDALLHVFTLDVYAERFHEGLDGVPARRWEKALDNGFQPRLPVDVEDLHILLGRTISRTVQHYGIEFEALRYNCAELSFLRAMLKGASVKVKYHPGDLSRVYAFNPFDQKYIEVPAVARDYTANLSLWKHRIIRSAVLAEKKAVSIETLGLAKRHIQQIVDDGRRRKRAGTRTAAARWNTAGRPSKTNGDRARDASPTFSPPPVDAVPKLGKVVKETVPTRREDRIDGEDAEWSMDFSLQDRDES